MQDHSITAHASTFGNARAITTYMSYSVLKVRSDFVEMLVVVENNASSVNSGRFHGPHRLITTLR